MEEFVITVALNLLQLPQVLDQVNMALACWGPDVLLHSRIVEMEELMDCYLEMLESRGRLVQADRMSMLDFLCAALDNTEMTMREEMMWECMRMRNGNTGRRILFYVDLCSCVFV